MLIISVPLNLDANPAAEDWDIQGAMAEALKTILQVTRLGTLTLLCDDPMVTLEEVKPKPRKLTATNSFEIPGRGRVWTMDEPDPVLQLGELVEINGHVGHIFGLERHPIAGSPKPGSAIGVMLKEDRWKEDQ